MQNDRHLFKIFEGFMKAVHPDATEIARRNIQDVFMAGSQGFLMIMQELANENRTELEAAMAMHAVEAELQKYFTDQRDREIQEHEDVKNH